MQAMLIQQVFQTRGGQVLFELILAFLHLNSQVMPGLEHLVNNKHWQFGTEIFAVQGHRGACGMDTVCCKILALGRSLQVEMCEGFAARQQPGQVLATLRSNLQIFCTGIVSTR